MKKKIPMVLRKRRKEPNRRTQRVSPKRRKRGLKVKKSLKMSPSQKVRNKRLKGILNHLYDWESYEKSWGDEQVSTRQVQGVPPVKPLI